MIEDVYPLSPLQEGIYYHWTAAPGSWINFEQMNYRIKGQLNVTLLEESYAGLVARHGALRTFFTEDFGTEILQVIVREVTPDFEYRNVSGDQDFSVEQFREADRNKGFNLHAGSQMRLTVLQLGEDTYEFIWSFHHIIMDAWCIGILINDFFSIYNSRLKGQTPVPGKVYPYSGYIKWLLAIDRNRSLSYWRNYLSGYNTNCTLPKRLHAQKRQLVPEEILFPLGSELSKGIKKICAETGVTENNFIQAIWGVLLSIYNNTNDVVFGSVVSGRPAEVEGVEKMVGLFINTIPMRVQTEPGMKVRELLKNVQRAFIDSTDHHYVQLAEIQAGSDAGRELFDHIILFENYLVQDMVAQNTGSQLALLSTGMFDQNNYDLTVVIMPGDNLVMKFFYNESVYEAAFMHTVKDRLIRMMEQVVSYPDLIIREIDCLSAAERSSLLPAAATKVFPGSGTLLHQFRQQAVIQPDKPAIVYEDQVLSYSELDEWSNQFATWLKATCAVAGGDRTGIQLERSEWLIVALLGVWKAGGVYVLLDSDTSEERLEKIITGSSCKAVIDDAMLLRFRKEARRYAGQTPLADRLPEDAACIHYVPGTSGHPAGLMFSHAALWNAAMFRQHFLQLQANDRGLQFASCTDDAFIQEVFPILAAGAALYIIHDAFKQNAILLDEFISANHINAAILPVSRLQLLKEESVRLLSKTITLRDQEDAGEFYIAYNPPASGIYAALGSGENTGAHVIYDTPAGDTQLYVLGNYGQLVPETATGEIYISSSMLADGYWNDPENTAAKWLPDPFQPGKIMYRTGDLGRWVTPGRLEYLGVKMEAAAVHSAVAQITSLIRQYPGVDDVVVQVKGGLNRRMLITAYFTGEHKIPVSRLKEYLSEKAADYILPDYIVQPDRFITAADGAIEMKALPDPETMDTAADAGFVAPRNETEEKLAVIWQQLLHRQQISARDRFFELGGQSITAIKLAGQINKTFEVKIPLKDLFRYNMLEEQALLIKRAAHTGYANIPVAEQAASYPLSSAQRRLWVLSQFEDGSIAYNMPAVYVFSGKLNIPLLEQSFRKLQARHEILRTVFRTDETGDVRQIVLDNLLFGIEYRDVQHLSLTSAELKAMVQEECLRPFDFSAGPLLRACLYQTAAGQWVFACTMHHIITDGWSMGILIRELLQAYYAGIQGLDHQPAPLRIQYKDYATWQQAQAGGAELQEHGGYWRQQLSGELPLLDLGNHRRPAVKTYNGGVVLHRFPPELGNKLHQLLQAEEATLFMGLLSAVNALLYRYSGQEDMIIGSPIAGREHSDLDDQIGFYVNMLALRSCFSGTDTYRRLLARVKQLTLDAYAHQMYPFDELVNDLQLQRDTSRNALFDVLVVLQNVIADAPFPALQDLQISGYAGEESTISKYDLTFTFSEAADHLHLRLEYNNDIYDHSFAAQLARHLEQLLSGMVLAPDAEIREVDYLTASEKRQLLEVFNDTAAKYPLEKTIISLFEEQVARTPDHIAVVSGDESLSYRELNELANRLGSYLKNRYGIGTDDLVGLVLERTEWMIVAILGVLKSGGAYVPVDPAYPQERIDYIFRDSQCKAWFDEKELALFRQEHAQYSGENVPALIQPESLAYVIYTSGSTGNPKGALITNRNVVRLFMTSRPLFDFGADDVWTMFHSYCFDFSVWEMYGALLFGGKLVMVPAVTARDPQSFIRLMHREGVTILNQTPSSFYNLIRQELQENVAGLKVRYVIFGGEALSPGALAEWKLRYPATRLINMYGITETTVHVTYKEIREEEIACNTSNIGRPIPTLYCYVLDQHQRLLPAGVPGELHVGGAGLARGYLNRDELTAQRFITSPFRKGERLYRSGDLVRMMENGEMEYIGRIDNQVKIRGYRIELGEIANALEAHPHIIAAVVIARTGKSGDKELVAYITGKEKPAIADIRVYLSGIIPAYMLPAHYVWLDKLPLTSNGKVAVKKLPDPDVAEQIKGQYTAPENEMQAALAAIWQQVLGIEKVGINDNFFNIGGNSISAIELLSRARGKGITLSIRQIFEAPTIAALSKTVKWEQRQTEVHAAAAGDMRLLPIQQWYFEQQQQEPHHFNYANIFITPEALNEAACRQIVERLYENHDVFRLHFTEQATWFEPLSEKMLAASLEVYDYAAIETAERIQLVNAAAERAQGSLSLESGPLMKLVWFNYGHGNKGRLLLIVHHLVTDGISWRILLEQVNQMMKQAAAGKTLSTGTRTATYQRWSETLVQYAGSRQLLQEKSYWLSVLQPAAEPFPLRPAIKENNGPGQYVVTLEESWTRQLMQECAPAYHTQINDLLLTALLIAVGKWSGNNSFLINMEGHGREALFDDLDVSQTVGWFTSLFPVLLNGEGIDTGTAAGMAAAIKRVKENLRAAPHNGIGYGVLRYLAADQDIMRAAADSQALMLFNFLGDFRTTQNNFIDKVEERAGNTIAATHKHPYNIEMNGAVLDAGLTFSINFHEAAGYGTATELGQLFKAALQAVITHCLSVTESAYTPSDLPYAKLTQERLDEVMADYPRLEDVYTATPMQQSIFFHSLTATQPGVYINQHHGYTRNIDPVIFGKALDELVNRHAMLRTAFVMCELNGVLQVVDKAARPEIAYLDLRRADKHTQARQVKELVNADAVQDFEFESAPLLRVKLIHTGDNIYYLIITFHHIILDGWSVPILFYELNRIYDALANKQAVKLPAIPPYRAYMSWMSRLPQEELAAFWSRELSRLKKVTRLSALPAAAPGNGTGEGYEQTFFDASEEVSAGLKKQAADGQVTLNSLLVAAWALLLSKYTGEEEVIFGMTMSGRSGGLEGIGSMVGLFINTIPFQLSCQKSQELGSWLKTIHHARLERDTYSYLGITEIGKLSPLGQQQPLFESLLVHQNYPVNLTEKEGEGANGAIDFVSSGFRDENNFPITLQVSEKKQLLFTIIYQREMFDPAFILQLITDLKIMLEWVAGAGMQDPLKNGLSEIKPVLLHNSAI
ncbi:non-ribosomal peptide synthetase [Chitinophaga sp. GbtcB8]|uniref:non-ribosomal peptide synthetase n=1 Tax=Chitinophaga sp. GbtcB8 TaxID=2824753 RepID=UPI001C2FA845|nr:non-ribosomal peptide synthetase [Chitinophaga sp. GbtcB8]